MQHYIAQWLTDNGVPQQYLELAMMCVGTLIVLLVAWVSYYLAKNQVLSSIEKLVSQSRNTWDDLIFEHHVFFVFVGPPFG